MGEVAAKHDQVANRVIGDLVAYEAATFRF